MAVVSITIPDALIPRLAAAARGGFPDYAGLSDSALFKKITADHWKGILKNWEAGQAEIAAQTQAATDSTGIG